MSIETAFGSDIRTQLQTQSVDRLIGELAEAQHGIVTRHQLIDLGVPPGSIGRRLRAGRLCRLHRGVYSLGHRLISREGSWMAAVLIGGEKAVLSHRSAASLWGLQRTRRNRIEITTPRATRSSATIHRHCASLSPDEVTTRRGIPVTTASRTLLDLAAVVPVEALELAMREAEVRRLALRPSWAELLARHSHRPGIVALRACLDRVGRLPADPTRSPLETQFLAFVVRYDLPRPQTGVLLDLGDKMFEVDFLWREPRLIVELDGHESHGTRAAFESDRERDRRLQAAGWTVVRITWRQLHDEPETVLADIHRFLCGQS